jgi:hypothetical protein
MLLGFSRARVITGIIAVLLLAAGFMTGNQGPLVGAVVIDVILIGAAAIRVQGRYIIEWVPLWGQWSARGVGNQRTYRARVTTARPSGTLALPGNATNLRFIDVGDAAYIHDPSAGTLTAALRVEHSAMVLLDADAQATRVGGWSRVMSSLAGTDTVDHVTIIEETIPDTGNGPVDWFLENWTKVDDWPSREYFAFLESNRTHSSTHRTTFTVTVKTGRQGVDDWSSGCALRACVLWVGSTKRNSPSKSVGRTRRSHPRSQPTWLVRARSRSTSHGSRYATMTATPQCSCCRSFPRCRWARSSCTRSCSRAELVTP